jgi:hypothetical protein
MDAVNEGTICGIVNALVVPECPINENVDYVAPRNEHLKFEALSK